MFGFLKRKKKKKESDILFSDLDGQPLKTGDMVLSFRYDLGKCKIIESENGFEYASVETGKRVHWSLMVDAATKFQKVKKVPDEQTSDDSDA